MRGATAAFTHSIAGWPHKLARCCQRQRFVPLRAQVEFLDPSLNVITIKGVALPADDARRVFELARRFAHLVPLQFREQDIFGCCEIHASTTDRVGTAPGEFRPAEVSILRDDQVGFPARCKVDDALAVS